MLTSFLHEGEEVIQKLLPFGIIVQLIQLKEKTEVYYHQEVELSVEADPDGSST